MQMCVIVMSELHYHEVYQNVGLTIFIYLFFTLRKQVHAVSTPLNPTSYRVYISFSYLCSKHGLLEPPQRGSSVKQKGGLPAT